MSSPESDLNFPVEKAQESGTPFDAPEILKGTELPPALDTRPAFLNTSPAFLNASPESLNSAPGNKEKDQILKGFTLSDKDNFDKHQGPAEKPPGAGPHEFVPPAPEDVKPLPQPASTDRTPPGAGPTDRQPNPTDQQPIDKQNLADKIAGMVQKIGQFLQSVLPPEYAQYVQQYLPMAEQYIGQFLKDVNLSRGQDGSNRLDLDLHESRTIPDVVPGSNLEVGRKLGFDLKWNGNGAEAKNIKGLRLKGQVNGDVTSGRVDIGDGNPTLYASVRGQDGKVSEVPIPLPDVQSLISQFQGQFNGRNRGRRR